MNAPRVLLVATCSALLLGVTACGNGAATGSGVNTKATGGPGNLFASSAPPTKKAAPKVTKAAPRPTKAAPVAPKPAPKPAQTQKAPQAPVFRITINGDKSGKPIFDPPQAAVFTGTKVTWVNADSVPRGVKAGNGAFDSGPIAPGKSYVWIAGGGGMYAYQDSTRPYVNAQIQVTGR